MINGYLKNVEQLLDITSREYGIYVMVHDFDGFLKNYVRTFPIEYGTINKYCHLIISDKHALKECLERQLDILKECNKGKPFHMMCRAGLEMLIVPIKGAKNVLGYIEAGKFCGDEDSVKERIQNMNELYGFKISDLESSYYSSTYKKTEVDMTALTIHLEAAAAMLSMLYTKMIQEYEYQTQITDKDSFCRHIEKYIELNYMSDLSINALSQFFSCSPSTITHTFKKYNGENLKAYINKIRINEARTLLSESNASVGTIAKKVGIPDANYFSKVFRFVVGMAPSEYQKLAKDRKKQ